MNPALLIAAPLLAAFIAVIFKKIDKVVLGVVAVGNIAYSIVMAVLFTGATQIAIGGFAPPFGISLVLDSYSLIGILLVNVAFGLILLMGTKLVGRYGIVLAVSLAALNGIVLTGDLFNLFVFIEVAAISAYIMTTMNKQLKHTFNYLILGTLASGLLLFGIAVLYNMFGSLNIIDIASKLAISGVSAGAMVLPIVFIFAGLSVEAKLIPFGGWVRGVLKKSNSLVGPLLVTGYAAAILLVFGRLTSTIFIMSDGLKIALTVVAVATLVLAEFTAFSKKNLREVLLFSSIAQSGLVVALFLNGLTVAAILVLVNNVVSKLVLFALSAKIADDTGTDKISELKGVFTKYRVLGVGFTIAAMSLIGLPMFFGFVAKAQAVMSLFESGNLWLPAVILLVSVIEGIYIIRILTTLWNSGKEGQVPSKDAQKEYKLNGFVKVSIVALVIGVLIVAAGILPITNIKEFLSSDFLSFITRSMGGV
ncbi:MAG: NADH-ubiquinone oxidoreductase [Clostridia bacterium]|jgi:formate hydrogenlyase subunit 3/multisubunit Na+/H+ antiporter MnhD subunit|nr:NADH-ubiquinone oxidoreductase [Clostridia bacterium]MBT7122200.1 NADH-ubiquinone oxidoreductase [Clostridia bacterium]